MKPTVQPKKWEKDLEKLVEYIFLKAGYWIVTYKGSKKDSWETKAFKKFIQSTLQEYAKEVEKIFGPCTGENCGWCKSQGTCGSSPDYKERLHKLNTTYGLKHKLSTKYGIGREE